MNQNDNLTRAIENNIKLSDGLYLFDKAGKTVTFGGKATFDTGRVNIDTQAGGKLAMRELSYRAKCFTPKATAIINLAVEFLKAKETLADDVKDTWQPDWKKVDYKDLPFQGESRKLARSIVNQLAKTSDSFAAMKLSEKQFDSGKVRGLHGDVSTYQSEIKADEAEWKIRARRVKKTHIEKVITPLSTAQGNVFRLRQGIASLKAFAPESAEIAKLEAKLEAELGIVADAIVAELKASK